MRVLEQTDEHTHKDALLQILYRQVEQLRNKPAYQGFHLEVRKWMSEGVYGNWIHRYSTNEIKWLGLQIVPERDQLLPIAKLHQYIKDVVTCNYYDYRLELPQERMMLIAMAAMKGETVNRLQKVQEAYWILSKRYVTLPDNVISFFGKKSHIGHSVEQHQWMDLLDLRIPSFVSSQEKEKHIRIPGTFMDQVKACGSWLLFDMEQVRAVMNCSIHDIDSEVFYQAVANPSIIHKKLSAIGLMKEMLASDGVVFHFDDDFQVKSKGLHSQIHLPSVLHGNMLARVCTIQIRLLNGIIDVWDQEDAIRDVQIEVTGWEELLAQQRINVHSPEAVSYVEQVSEEINMQAIKASIQLAKEKGRYPLFEGSHWQDGRYFEERNYRTENWSEIRMEVARHGIRNGSLHKASDTENISGHPLTKHQQKVMIDRLTAQQYHTDIGGSLTLERSALIEMAELLQLLLRAWSGGIKEVWIK